MCPARKIALQLVLVIGGVVLPGCAASPRAVIQTFHESPESFRDLTGKQSVLSVERAHLDLAPDAAYADASEWSELSGIADIAFRGGDPKGFAGIFVFDAGSAQTGYSCLAVRSTGEWRVYRSSRPGDPAGGRGWQAGERSTPTGFTRLGVHASRGEARFFIDGREVEKVPVVQASGRLRFGLFTQGASSRWKNFIAGPADDASFRADDHVQWGDSSDGEALLLEARAEAKTFKVKPSRDRLYATVASLEEAKNAFARAGDPKRARAASDLAGQLSKELQEGSARLGLAELHDRAFARLTSPGGGRTLKPGGARELAPDAAQRIEDLRASPPLRLDFVLSASAQKPAFDPNAFGEAVREVYGALERSSTGELKVRVQVLRSSNETDLVRTERKIPATPKGGLVADLETELSALEKRIADDLLDAKARADVVRGSARVLGPGALASLAKFQIDGEPLELEIGDGKGLEASIKRRDAVRADLAKEVGKAPRVYRTIPATSQTSSILVEASYSVTLDGKTLVNVEKERTYLGIEQWSHGADTEAGIVASKIDPGRVDGAVASVKDRAIRRFRTAISTRSLVAKLPAEDRLGFLARFARATRQEEDISNLQWALREDLGLTGTGLDQATRRCLE